MIPAGRTPQQYRSALHAYTFRVRAVTHAADDPFQVSLYTVADVVGDFLLTPPALTLSLCHFDALVVDAPPDVGTQDDLQFVEWTLTINVRRTT